MVTSEEISSILDDFKKIDDLLKESQRDRTGNSVWVNSDHHPDEGYWCDDGEANQTWQNFKNRDNNERRLR